MLRIITALLLAGVVCVAQAKHVVLHTNYGDIKMVLEEEKAL